MNMLIYDHQSHGFWYVIPADKEEDFYSWGRSLMSYEEWAKGPPDWAKPVSDPRSIRFDRWELEEPK